MKESCYQNKNILVVGGTFGIGEELCRQFASLGANLCISGRSEDKITSLLKELDGNHLGIKCDILSLEDLLNLQTRLHATWKTIDIIIFCAGIYEPMNFDNFHLKKAESIIDVNLKGFIKFQSAFLGDFKSSRIKHIAVISSIAGYFGMPNSMSGYGASKAGLSNLVESLYYALKKYHTKVQIINPGFVESRLTAQNSFKMPGIISSKKASAIILKQLQSKRFEIKFPFIFAFVIKLLSILPYRVRFFLVRKST